MVMAGTCRPGVATFQATAYGRLAHAGFGLSALDRTKRVLGERVLGNGVSVMRSALDPEDGPGRHPSDEGTDNDTATTMRQQQMTNKTETFFGCSRFPLCKRVVHAPLATERASPSVPSCSAAQPSEVQAMQVDSDSVGSEESFNMWNVPAESQPEQEFLLEQLQLLSSSGITGQQALRAIV